MKSKLNLKLILISILLVLLSLALVACANKSGGGEGGGGEGGGGDKPVATTFTVSFNSNGSSMVYDDQQVVYGGKVANPNKGDTANDPFKTGYTFKWWSQEGNTDIAWDFDTNTITTTTTLIAVYDANRYIHTLDLNNTNPEAHCDQTTFTSTYNQSTTMPTPTCMDDHGNASDQFLYWYYLDADNKEVRFSNWISYTMQTSSSAYSSSTDYYTRDKSTYSIPDVQPTSSADFDRDDIKYFVKNSLSESNVFTLDKVLTLKAKWYSQLPAVEDEDDPIAANKVIFLPDNGSAESSVVVKYNDTVTAPTEPIKTNYKFDGWYIAVENENGTIEYDGKKYSLTSTEFHFDTGIGCGEFDKVTDKTILAAKWTRYFEIASAADWETLAGMIKECDIEYHDLDDIPHVVIKERPSRKDVQELQGLVACSRKTGINDKDRIADVERNEDRNETFAEESLEVVFFRLKAGIKTIAREEEEDTYEENAEFLKETYGSRSLRQLL